MEPGAGRYTGIESMGVYILMSLHDLPVCCPTCIFDIQWMQSTDPLIVNPAYARNAAAVSKTCSMSCLRTDSLPDSSARNSRARCSRMRRSSLPISIFWRVLSNGSTIGYATTGCPCPLQFFDDSTVNEINWRIARTMGIHPAYSEFMEREYHRAGECQRNRRH